ncbi:membrane protease YdiL (CAAX protease family) [Chryseobacterium ginsenosidimutans]|uniref:CPBP family intramembrane glutamic endopeptidase n=1 Tax=Chryseobacterium ginsenosidimutans TaxID=687846 RepID=UPI0027853C7E|nr:type II CAAX endopeptidase family protein [Chryseobacterium ginsenosidimutans]MDQ0591793.1 membrane protease YdiL (CAAX protease family) [Chryseobacterium ginsenosidimutans]
MINLKVLLNNKWVALLLLAVAFSLIYNPFTKFPYTFCVIIAVILLFTYLQDGNLKNLNFKKLGPPEIKIILISYLVLELSMDFIFQPLVSKIFNEPADYSSFKIIEGNPQQYFKWLFNMWISAAIGEELLFRGFAFSQFKKLFGEKKIWLVLVSAVLFSLPHLYQGISGLVMTFLFGLAFGFMYLKFKNIWINIIVHGLIDTVFLTLSYYGLTDFYSGFNIIL